MKQRVNLGIQDYVAELYGKGRDQHTGGSRDLAAQLSPDKSMKLKEPFYLRELRDCEYLPTDIALGLWNWFRLSGI